MLLIAAGLLFGSVQAAIPRSVCKEESALVRVTRPGETFRLTAPRATGAPAQSPKMTMGIRTTCVEVEANKTLAVILAAFGIVSIWYATKF